MTGRGGVLVRRSTALIRVRFPPDVVAYLDEVATRLGAPRAAVIRALVVVHLDAGTCEELLAALAVDPVRRGKRKVARAPAGGDAAGAVERTSTG